MPKRSSEEKLHSYRRKIRKLEEKEKRKKKEKEKPRRRIRRLLDSSDDENNEDSNIGTTGQVTEPQGGPATSPDNGPSAVSATQSEDGAPPEPDTAAPPPASPAEAAPDTEPPLSGVSLDPELLSALGASTSDTPDFGENIHESLTKLWTPILRKGLPKEVKESLSKEYLLPGNCKLLQAPKLNAEISAAVAEVVRGRDKKLVRFQQQLGLGTAAISRGLDTLLTSNDKVTALKQLSDGCRFLNDLHFLLSKDRIKLITPSLEKNFLTVIQDAERDDTLFGSSLSEKIKASQAINKQGSQIKATNQKTTGVGTSSGPPTTTRHAQGNWSGPPRYSSSRGGRGGQRKPAASMPRRNYPPTHTQAKPFNQPKTRAAPQ